MLTKRQNLLETIRGGNPDRFVNQWEAFAMIGGDPIAIKNKRPEKGDPDLADAWGVVRRFPENQFAAFPIHDDEHKVVKDITKWREVVQGPSTQSEIIVHYDPYKTKTTTLSETKSPTQPTYELHQNGQILSYSYDFSEDTYWISKTTKEDYPDQSFFDSTYFDEGERSPGLFAGIIDYEIIEEDDEQVVIKATINSSEVYENLADIMDITTFTQTVYFNKKNHQVVKVEGHQIQNMEEIAPHLELDGKSVKEFDITVITEYKDINSSKDFKLPEGKELELE